MKKNAKKTPLNEEFEDVKMEVTKICHAIEVLQKHRMNKMDRYKKGLWSKLEKDKVQSFTPFADGIFRDTLGGNVQVAYHLGQHLLVFGNFRWVGRISPPTQPQTNNTSGFQLGIVYRLWKSTLNH